VKIALSPGNFLSRPLPGEFSPDAQGYAKMMVELNRAFATEDTELDLCSHQPAFNSMCSDPRYKELMRKIGLPE
jgi:hypothetical protein